MKTKTIRKVIRAKIDEWLETIEDADLRKRASKKVIVTGGCIASMLLREKVNDFDVYFRDYETTLAMANYYISRFKPKGKNGIPCRIYLTDDRGREITPSAQARDGRIKIVVRSDGIASEDGAEKPYEYFEARPEGEAESYVAEVMNDPGDIEDAYEETQQKAQEIEDDGKPKYRPVFLSTNAITLSHRVQLIIRFYGDPDAIHENYDFVHCTNYWRSWDDELVLRPEALEALLTRELRYVGSKYPVCSVIRLRKFLARGWTVNAGQILKMLMQVSCLDLTDFKTLEDQLTGVDAAYFMQVIAALKEKSPEKVNAAYLIEIIDRMF